MCVKVSIECQVKFLKCEFKKRVLTLQCLCTTLSPSDVTFLPSANLLFIAEHFQPILSRTITLAIIFSTVLCNVNVPLPRGKRIRLFALFPVSITTFSEIFYLHKVTIDYWFCNNHADYLLINCYLLIS